MIELNLLPRDYRKVQKEKKSAVKIKVPKVAPTPFIIGTISVILLSLAGLGILAATQRKSLTKLKAELARVAPQEIIANNLKKELDELSRRFTVIESLTSGSLVWSRKLYDLNQTMIDGVWITSLYLKSEKSNINPFAIPARGGLPAPPTQHTGDKQAVILEGSAVSMSPGEETAIVGNFIDSLKNNEDFFRDFEDIKLSSIQRNKVGDVEVMKFTIMCYFKQGRSYFEKLAAGD